MGLMSALRLSRSVVDAPATANVYLLDSGTDAAQVLSDPQAAAAFGINLDSDTVTRADAMRVPAVRRGRQVIAGTIGALELVAHRTQPDGTVVDVTADRPLLQQPDPNTTRQWVLTWTVDDLVFYGVSWWRVTDRDPEGYPRRAERLTQDRIRVDLASGRVFVDGRYVRDADLIRFDGPDEGVLTYGGRTLRTAILLEDAVRRFAKLDIPLGVLQPEEGAPELTADEIQELLTEWELARQLRTTAYLNRSLTYTREMLNAEETQLPEARAFQTAEVARLMNLAPRYVNAPSASSMTYANVGQDRQDLVDTSLVGYLTAIEQRLSMGDATPRGTAVRFDLARFLRGDTMAALQAAQLAVQLEAMTTAEVRTDVLGRPPLTPGQQPPTPAPGGPTP